MKIMMKTDKKILSTINVGFCASHVPIGKGDKDTLYVAWRLVNVQKLNGIIQKLLPMVLYNKFL